MRGTARSLSQAAIVGGFCFGAAMAADLSSVGQWLDKYPDEKIAAGGSLWEQPGVQDAMRAAMGNEFYELSKKKLHGPEGPVTGDKKGLFAAWSCKSHDCGGNQMTVFFETTKGSAQVCWRSSASDGGDVHDLWLADGKARPLPINACGFVEKDAFAAYKKYGGKGDGKPL